jgi:hypothetical protein
LANPLYFMVYLVRFGAGLYWPPLLLRGFLDPFLGRALIGFGVPFVASALMFGRLQEHRVLVELMPLLWLAAIQALAAWTAVQQRAPGDRRRDDSTTADSGAPMGLIITVSSATVPGNGASPGGPARPIITVPSGGREARQPQPRRTSH